MRNYLKSLFETVLGTLLKSNFKHLQIIELNLLLFLNVIRKISTLQQNHRNRCASPLVLLIPNYFRDNLKLAILQISNPLTSNLFWNVLFVSPFSQEQLTCNLICQINFNIYAKLTSIYINPLIGNKMFSC